MNQNFIEYGSFPYNPSEYKGSETALINLDTFWNHYYEKYMNQMKQATILEEEYENWQRREGFLLTKKREGMVDSGFGEENPDDYYDQDNDSKGGQSKKVDMNIMSTDLR